jgi:hypothetical protein
MPLMGRPEPVAAIRGAEHVSKPGIFEKGASRLVQSRARGAALAGSARCVGLPWRHDRKQKGARYGGRRRRTKTLRRALVSTLRTLAIALSIQGNRCRRCACCSRERRRLYARAARVEMRQAAAAGAGPIRVAYAVVFWLRLLAVGAFVLTYT